MDSWGGKGVSLVKCASYGCAVAGQLFIGSCSEECVECVLQLRCPAGVHLGDKEEEDLGEHQACSETKPGQGIQG